MNAEENEYGSIVEGVAKQLLSFFGISEEQVDKVKTIIDNIDIKQENGTTIIEVKTKSVKIIIEK